MYKNNSGVTLLEDLPELQDFDTGAQSRYNFAEQDERSEDATEKYKRHIRETMKIPRESGLSNLSAYTNQNPYQIEGYQNQTQIVNSQPQHQYITQNTPYQNPKQHYGSLSHYGVNGMQLLEGYREGMETQGPVGPKVDCKSVYDHVTECNICERLYKSQMNLYLIIIAALVVLCLLLIKKVLSL